MTPRIQRFIELSTNYLLCLVTEHAIRSTQGNGDKLSAANVELVLAREALHKFIDQPV